MSETLADSPSSPLLAHGAEELSRVRVDSYNVELRSADGFVGDRASKRAFQAILDDWREQIAKLGDDPLGEVPSEEISKKQLDKLLIEGEAEAAGMIHSAVEEFAQEFAAVIRRFLRLKDWKNVERIVVGGGLRESRIGELAIGRAAVCLKAKGHEIELRPIHHAPDHAGLIGSVHLVPSWILAGHDSILAVDIGGSNIRAGIVELHGRKDRISPMLPSVGTRSGVIVMKRRRGRTPSRDSSTFSKDSSSAPKSRGWRWRRSSALVVPG